jgi:hypothetical protein
MKRLLTVTCIVGWVLATGVVQASQAKGQLDPTKGSKNVDESVPFAPDAVLAAAREALLAHGCEIDPKKTKPDYLECKRAQHVGVFVGSGGEKITIRLTAAGDGTRVEVRTVKGFVGMAGMKNWSTPVFRELMQILKGSQAPVAIF